jgi:hypothetical protein
VLQVEGEIGPIDVGWAKRGCGGWRNGWTRRRGGERAVRWRSCIEPGCGSSDGAAHCDYKIWDGTSVGVHEAESPLRDCDVGNEHGCFGDGGIVGEP